VIPACIKARVGPGEQTHMPGTPLPALHTVRFQGKIRVFTCGLPEDALVDLSGEGTHHMYATCWIDGERGRSAHVAFSPDGGAGTFEVELGYRESGDSNALKIQFCMRMLDPDSHNRRSVEICMGHAWADKMLRGETDRFRVANQFTDGNFIDVEMRALNAGDFRNAGATAGPLLAFSPSKVELLAEGNADMQGISKGVVEALKRNQAEVPGEGGGFIPGMTRFPFPPLLLFVSLCLGTPAYALLTASRTGAGSTSRPASPSTRR